MGRSGYKSREKFIYRYRILLLVCFLVLCSVSYSQANDDDIELVSRALSSEKTLDTGFVIDDGLWVVEEVNKGARIQLDGLVVPYEYEKRLLGWGVQWRMGLSLFETNTYAPAIKGDHYETTLGFRYGFSWGSWELRMGYGMFDASNDSAELLEPTFVNSSYRLGVAYQGEGFFFSRYLIPYIDAGAYIFDYAVGPSDGLQNEFSSEVFAYAVFGFNFPFSWLDEKNAIQAQRELNLSEAMIYVEGRKLFTSGQEDDFETNIHLAAGLSFIF